MAAASGSAYTPDEVEHLLHAWSRRQFFGVDRVFDALEAARVPAAVLSNTNATHWRRLMALDGGTPENPIVLRAQHHFASHILGVAKPDPRVFTAVSAATGAAPHRILFFDDIEAYVEAARAAAWQAEHIDASQDTPSQLLRHLRRFGIVPLEDHHGHPLL